MLTFLDARLEVSVHAQDMLRDHAVLLFVRIVGHDEQEIETGQERVGQGDVLVRVFVNVVLEYQPPMLFVNPTSGAAYLAIDGVGSCENRATGIERRVYTGFGNSDRLLFHDLMDGDSVDVGHLVKFVDTHHASVGKNHRTSLETALS